MLGHVWCQWYFGKIDQERLLVVVQDPKWKLPIDLISWVSGIVTKVLVCLLHWKDEPDITTGNTGANKPTVVLSSIVFVLCVCVSRKLQTSKVPNAKLKRACLHFQKQSLIFKNQKRHFSLFHLILSSFSIFKKQKTPLPLVSIAQMSKRDTITKKRPSLHHILKNLILAAR